MEYVDKTIEEVETGYILTVESTRGTGVRDQDTVKFVGKSSEYPDEKSQQQVVEDVKERINRLRENQPD